MKRSLDTAIASSNDPAAGPAVGYPRPYQRLSGLMRASTAARSTASLPSATTISPATATAAAATSAAVSCSPSRSVVDSDMETPRETSRRRLCGLELNLREDGLMRLVLSFLDVREHQLVKSCCRAWTTQIQTLAMEKLDLSRASPVTTSTMAQAFRAVVYNYSSVRQLTLSGQRGATDRDVLVLTSCYWARLESITVDDCLQVTDFALLSILNAQSQRLQRVSLRHCKQVMGAFGHALITGRHPMLEVLDVSDTRVGFAFVDQLERKFPSLQEIHASHTPAQTTFLERVHWQDLVQELSFIVGNDMSEMAHAAALLDEFAARVVTYTRRYGARNGHGRGYDHDHGGGPGNVKNSSSMSVFQRSLLAMGNAALLSAPLPGHDGMSALLVACALGHGAIASHLVRMGQVALDLTDMQGNSALILAVRSGLTDVVRQLLRAGADVDHRTHCLATPLYVATELNQEDMVDLLLLEGHAETESAVLGGATALCVAAKNGNRHNVQRVLDTQLAKQQNQQLKQQQQKKMKQQQKKMMAAEMELLMHSLQHVHALFLACERGFLAIVDDLLARTSVHANVLMDASVSPLYLACQMGHVDVVALLLANGADANFRRPQGGVSCLYIAAQEGQTAIVELLMHHRVDVQQRMGDASTALHIAARMGHVAVARVLLHHGAGLQDQTRSGLSPLYIASEEGHLEMVQFLLRHGADVAMATGNGTSPLFVACQKGHAEVVRALLQAGADPQQAKLNGTCPMDAASLLGHYEVTQLLLHFGARVGGLSLHFAERRRDLKLQALLMDRYYEQHYQHCHVMALRAPVRT